MSEEHQESTSFIAPSVEELDSLFNGYHFESFIAQGGMGAVYLARQTSLDRQVAVKVLPREFGEDEEFRKSFQSEAKLMAKLNHPNLIGIYDFGDVDGMLYIIMEFVKGKSLHDSAHGKAIKQETAVEIISAICSGLDHAHAAGILHRDIKPANILLGKNAVPKVGDFGLARPSGNTETGVIYGTPGYSAPEVLGAPEKVDNRTDIFAVGVMFYELLTGHMPGESYESVAEFVDSDVRFDEVIQKAIHPDITKRHSSAEEFADELRGVLKKPSAANKLLVAGSSRPSSPAKIVVPVVTTETTLKTTARQTTKASSPSELATPVTPEGSDNAKMIRNIVIIFLLLGAIYAVLEMKKVKEVEVAEQQKIIDAEAAQRQKENAEHKAAIDKERRIDAEARNAERGTNRGVERSTKEDVSPHVVVQLSPMEKLAKVKLLLANGERPMELMPETIFKRDQGSRMLMYVDKKMTWDEADTWAREHGGYLAVCRSKSDLTIFMNQIPAEAGDVWLGAGCSGDKGWSWVDDTPWTDTLDLKPTYNRSFAKVSKYGSIGKTSADNKCHFFIEWRTDGTNPGDLEYRLLRTSDTLSDINPKYPSGTITVGARNYCFIKSPMTYDEARKLAIASGGHLIAISNKEEKFEVEAMLAKYCKVGSTFWTAGEKQNAIWSWQTGEEWQTLDWLPAHPKKGKYLAFIVRKSLMVKDMVAGKKATGFIIEWSGDKSRVKVASLDGGSGSNNVGLTALKSKARALVKKQQETTERNHASNVKKLWSDLETYLRGLPKSVRIAESVLVNKIIATVKDKPRVPNAIAGQGPSKRSRDYTNYAIEKQVRIDSEHSAQMKLLRTAYLKQLQKLKQEYEAKGQKSAVKSIVNEAKNIGNSVSAFENYFQ